jgi:hypothetical protein
MMRIAVSLPIVSSLRVIRVLLLYNLYLLFIRGL